MNFGIAFQLLPEAENIQKALATIQRLEADPDVKAAIETFERVAKILATSQKQEVSGVQGGQ